MNKDTKINFTHCENAAYVSVTYYPIINEMNILQWSKDPTDHYNQLNIGKAEDKETLKIIKL